MEQRVLLIIPAYNEETNILSTYNRIKHYNQAWDVIVINDGSKDRTAQICKDNQIPYIDLVFNLGIGGAMQTGYKYALYNHYDIAVQFDGDGQHNIEYVSDIIEPILKNEVDFCIGSRFLDTQSDGFKSTQARRIGIKFISQLIKLMTGHVITDPTSGFRGADNSVIKMFAESYPTDYPEPETIAALLFNDVKIKEVPVKMNEREGGVSSIRAWKSAYYMISVCFSILVKSSVRKTTNK